MSLVIESKAPVRMDLAGGTLDIWPLYLLLDHPITINMGIDLFAKATLESKPSKQGKITLTSLDLKFSQEWSPKDFLTQTAPPSLILHQKLLRFFAEFSEIDLHQQDLSLTTQALSPSGAGLGGSSALAVAMVGCLNHWSKLHYSAEELITIVKDIESQVLKIPAGIQDYYGAMYGGLQALHWRVNRHDREELSSSLLEPLKDRILLFYSGKSRNSGINNWDVFKKFLDGDSQTRELFEGINSATHSLHQALNTGDWKLAGEAIQDEWSYRKRLAPGISTSEMERALDAARKLGATAFKVCGAGGGGCFFVYLPSGDLDQKESIIKTVTGLFEKDPIRHLPFNPVPGGISISS